jgi:hypothetical protein
MDIVSHKWLDIGASQLGLVSLVLIFRFRSFLYYIVHATAAVAHRRTAASTIERTYSVAHR